MRVIRWVARLLMVGLVIAAAAAIVERFEIADRLTDLYLSLSPRLPTWVSMQQFLVIFLVASLLVAVVAVLFCALLGTFLWSTVLATRAKYHAHQVAMERAMEQLKTQTQQAYDRLIGLSATLTQSLEKRTLLQNILRMASQVTSLPSADSTVALWSMNFETDRLRFEMGLRCDQGFFTQREFDLNEPFFTKMVASPQVIRAASWREGFPFLVREKAEQLGQTQAVLLVPLVIERSVLGCLVVFCHPDLLQDYPSREAFFNTAWGQLALALSIAIQGELAMLDRLTGVVNRGYFMKRFVQEAERCDRYHAALGLLMIDVDNFKMVNDTLGHLQGDKVLQAIGRLLRQAIRAIDLVGRYGGEEFIVMLPETGGSEEERTRTSSAMVVAERIRKAVEDEFHEKDEKPLRVTVSIGVAVRRYPEDRRMDAETLVRLADEQLYKAKTTGKNRCALYVPEQPASIE
jgi:diguanylate cyclase (GGDEF)-like protein